MRITGVRSCWSTFVGVFWMPYVWRWLSWSPGDVGASEASIRARAWSREFANMMIAESTPQEEVLRYAESRYTEGRAAIEQLDAKANSVFNFSALATGGSSQPWRSETSHQYPRKSASLSLP